MARDPLPAEASEIYICVSGRLGMFIHGGFTTRGKADAWAKAANIWHGVDHPFYPIRVEPLKMDVRPFPAGALQAMQDAETPEAENAALHSMFATLVDDEPAEEPPAAGDEPDPAPRRGGRR